MRNLRYLAGGRRLIPDGAHPRGPFVFCDIRTESRRSAFFPIVQTRPSRPERMETDGDGQEDSPVPVPHRLTNNVRFQRIPRRLGNPCAIIGGILPRGETFAPGQGARFTVVSCYEEGFRADFNCTSRKGLATVIGNDDDGPRISSCAISIRKVVNVTVGLRKLLFPERGLRIRDIRSSNGP